MVTTRFEPDTARTEGGEALPVATSITPSHPGRYDLAEATPVAGSRWYALWTRSHCERLVYDQLIARGFELFLPTVEVWSRRGGARRRIRVPMFSGYLFLRSAMDKAHYIEVRKARGLVAILGERWDRLSAVPDQEIEAVQTVVGARLPVLPHAYLQEGQRVRIIRGPLADVQGILVRQDPRRGLLVLSVALLQQSVAVEVDCTDVVPT
ncbi:MAG: hypothetical protein E6G99_09230 [Bacillati bacterium ANGP1]|uniref:NusG-like N-terminal domain-containing protein n=1 Tax=Candidatus Segetimicrobium genomatis TaxID=2569760 RepID=A0A537LZR4_9BACT|nr:MAG: hypothetical protein E6G99_09230 [Terrabacteria group bacterium ANGP1]TMJ13520.1 MAG: hypothetical protein E6G98_00260 [Terrabacteria group bacterium ANGP1]